VRTAPLPDVLRYRNRPPCGHELLVECPLTARDWEEVFHAMLAFRAVCRSVSVRAHERADNRQKLPQQYPKEDT